MARRRREAARVWPPTDDNAARRPQGGAQQAGGSPPPPNIGTMRLLLLRHGQTHGNTAGALDTAVPGLDLTDLGHRQAEAAARALGDQGVDRIYVSTLTRTHQTA